MSSRYDRLRALVAEADPTVCAELALGYLATWADLIEEAQTKRPCEMNEREACQAANTFEAVVACCSAALPGRVCNNPWPPVTP